MSEETHDTPPPLPTREQLPSWWARLSASITAKKNLLLLLVSVSVIVLLPAFGMRVLLRLSALHPPFFSQIWSSKFDICGRLWIFASFISTRIVTGSIINKFLFDSRYNDFRQLRPFRNASRWILRISDAWIWLGLIALFTPTSYFPIWILKFLAFGLAAAMWWMDSRILRVVKDSDLEDEFKNTVEWIDRPTTFSIGLVIVLSFFYLLLVFQPDPHAPHEGEVFVLGLSSGAVAVELWFANFFFWYLLGESNDEV